MDKIISKHIQTDKAQVPVRMPAMTNAKPRHKHQNMDRAIRAAVARVTGGISPHSASEAWSDWALHLSRSPGRQLELAERAQSNMLKTLRYSTSALLGKESPAPFAPKDYDHRFADLSWKKAPFNIWQQSFLAVQDWWDQATDNMRGLHKQDADRTRFQMRQLLDLVAPSNLPWMNPEILAETVRTGGKNLVDGASHFAEDMIQTLTQTHKPAPDGYKIGIDLACTPGEVVFRNELFELIQYAPQTDKVQAEPVLFIPAWIMKYYILDLSLHNSMINYLVQKGFTVFMISWCNPTADQAELSLEDYRLSGVLAALDAINAIAPDRKIHANGYCLGGTLLAITAATMARDGDDRLASVTLMAAQVDFAEAGELLLFVDESQVAFVEDMMWDQGFLDRPQMARTFSAIRAEDLIYTRAVNRYFLGKDDLPTDIGVWNGDTTRMPARMHSEYLRGLFLENRLTAGRFAVEGRVIALKDISVPMFVIATETDHIAPWRSVYKTKLFTDCDLTFVLTKGGHNGGILSEPGHAGRDFRIGHRAAGAFYEGPDHWLAGQTTVMGSWWPDYANWLSNNSSDQISPPSIGNPLSGYPPLCAAPGTYVHQT
ncbi:PHA/PHB synthase family protein [Sulfitobacter sp. MF3-043]